MQRVQLVITVSLTLLLLFLMSPVVIASSASADSGGAANPNNHHALTPTTTNLVATINPPNASSFDIGFYAHGIYYLADRTAGGIDMIDALSNGFLGTITGFVGVNVTCGSACSGPNGVVVIPKLQEAWGGDGDSTVKVVDLASNKIVNSIPTGGQFRADEIAYDQRNNIILVANDHDTPPFLTFISVATQQVIGHIYLPNAIGGLEQPVWNHNNGMFYESLPSTTANPGGEVDEISPISMQIINVFPVTNCQPNGLVLGPHDHLLLGCTEITDTVHAESLIMNAHNGRIVATITQVGGSDEVAYDSSDGLYYLASDAMTSNGYSTGNSTPVLGIINAFTNKWVENVPTGVPGASAHSVAVDPVNNHIFVPVGGAGILVFKTVLQLTYYTVQPGDSLYAIGLQFNVPWHQIAQTNQIVPPYTIYVGEQLIIPISSNSSFTHTVK
ncbi:MAG: LysM peptidoglycan-binding domain-containing protein [Nitrososphaerales archaeon]